ncbi:MAG TPA: ABC transporter permease subunit [Tepidisphaeraceae bacterium]|nr:ABC transporter permease subunit [Tepidisphaeraceae bacterium]
MPRKRQIFGSLKRLLIWVLLLATWEAAFRLAGWKAWQFPAPSTLWPALLDLLSFKPAFGGRLLITGIGISLSRLAAGFLISILLGALLGLLMWRFRALDDFLGPLFLGLQTLPSVCWVPLAVLVIGLNETGVLFVVVMGSFFAIAIALRDGLRTIPPIYQRAGAMLGTTGWKMYRYVLLPASLPALASSLRQGFSFAWRSLMGAELIFAVSRHGLGFLLEIGRSYNDVAQVVVVMVVMVVIGILADRFFFGRVEKTIHRRFGLVRAE